MTIAADRTVSSNARAGVASEAARAKINLALHVRGRRPDGYHALETLAVFAEIGDELHLEEGEPGLEVEGGFAHQLAGEPVGTNLVSRAVAALSAAAGIAPPEVYVRLRKNLPVGAGLGGGSADAAAMLRLVVRHAGLTLGAAALEGIAAALGADVPMCFRSEPLIARGKGEELTPVVGIPPLDVVLAWPAVSVSTAMVFSRLGGHIDAELPPFPAGFSSAADFVRWLRLTHNGLEQTARDCAPVIGHALQALSASPGCMFARMSGSGSTSFGIYPFRDAAEHAARLIRAAQPGWWVIATTTGGS